MNPDTWSYAWVIPGSFEGEEMNANTEPAEIYMGVKAKGEDNYHQSIDVYPGNEYNVLIRIPVLESDYIDGLIVSSRLDLAVCNTFWGNNGVISVSAKSGKETSDSRSGTVFLRSKKQVILDITNGPDFLNFSEETTFNQSDDLFSEQGLFFAPKHLVNRSFIEISMVLRSIPLELSMTTYNLAEDHIDYYIEAGPSDELIFQITCTNTGDQFQKDIRIFVMLPIELEYVIGSTTISRKSNVYTRKKSNREITGKGVTIDNLAPGDEFVIDFEAKLSERITPGRKYNDYLACAYMTAGKAGFWRDQVQIRVTDQENSDEWNNPVYDDKSQFVLVRNIDSNDSFSSSTRICPGDELEVVVSYHNDTCEDTIIPDTGICIELSDFVPEQGASSITAQVGSESRAPGKKQAKAILHSETPFEMRYIDGTAVLFGVGYNDGLPVNPNQLFGKGWKIQYMPKDNPYTGWVPGNCDPFYVIFRLETSGNT